MTVVAILNTSADTVELLHSVFEDEGFSVVDEYVVALRRGERDIGAFFRAHRPQAVVYDVALPYEENWRFLYDRVLPESGLSHLQFVLTTTNKQVLERLVGPNPAIEMVGKPFDLDEIVLALKRAISAPSGT